MTMNRTWELDAAQIDAGDGRHSLYVAMNAATREVVTAVGDNKAHPEDAITDLLFEILRHHDEPELVITDSAPAFTSPGVAATFAKFGIRHEVRKPFSERRGAVERAVKNVMDTVEVQAFIAAVRKEGGPLANLPEAVLERQFHDDDKGAFIVWFEGRSNFQPDDWALLLVAVRHSLPPMFPPGDA